MSHKFSCLIKSFLIDIQNLTPIHFKSNAALESESVNDEIHVCVRHNEKNRGKAQFNFGQLPFPFLSSPDQWPLDNERSTDQSTLNTAQCLDRN